MQLLEGPCRTPVKTHTLLWQPPAAAGVLVLCVSWQLLRKFQRGALCPLTPITASSLTTQPGMTADPQPMVTRLPMHTSAVPSREAQAAQHVVNTACCAFPVSLLMPLPVKEAPYRAAACSGTSPGDKCHAGDNCRPELQHVIDGNCTLGCYLLKIPGRPCDSTSRTVELDTAVLHSVCHHKGEVINHGAIANGEAIWLIAAVAGQQGQVCRHTDQGQQCGHCIARRNCCRHTVQLGCATTTWS